ncbi:hypothetical protein WJX73_004347 [Symbiochloris irregularis]|uniref:Uncharacterized protein n=1 Tax=Symbiochloris irregularis TaxID=706552 RepID=A0AAW1PGA7_9CHLO
MERLKQCFRDTGLEPADIPAAFVIHEVISVGIAVGFWSACHAVQPSQRFFTAGASTAGRNPGAQRLYNSALLTAEKTVARMPWLKRVPVLGRDTTKLTVSLAESIAVRACIKPVTFPFKIWASYQVVMLAKRAGWQTAIKFPTKAQATT